MNPRAFSPFARRPGARLRLLLLTFLGVVTLASSVAAKGFAIGEWSDEEIREHVEGLMADVKITEEHEGAICLNHSTMIETSRKKHQRTVNQEFLVLDPSAEGLADVHQQFDRQAEFETVAGWIVRADGELVRLDDDDIIEREGDGERFGEVVMSFPNLDEGDVIGTSVTVEIDGYYPGGLEKIATRFPVLSGGFYLQGSGDYGYRIAARNFDAENLDLQARDKQQGASRLLLARYVDIPAIRDESFALPREISTPYLDVYLKAVFIEFGGEWAWLTFSTWNQQAASARQIADGWTSLDEVEDLAEELTDGIDGDQAKQQVLFDYVARQIETVDYPFSYLGLANSVATVIEDRKGSTNEKAFLLYGLMREAGLPAAPAYLRSYHVGDVDRRDPTLSAFAHLAVYTGIEGSEWLWPGHHWSEPGALPPYLRQSTAFLPHADAGRKLEKAGRAAARDANRSLVRYVKALREAVRKEPWYDFVETAGNPLALAAWTRETVAMDPASGEARLSCAFHRNDWEVSFRARSADEIDQREELIDYLGQRWPERGIGEGALEEVEVAESDSACRVVTAMESWNLPQPQGEIWILPTKELVGSTVLDDWEGADRGPMFVGTTRDYDLTLRIPLPEGWRGLVEPPEFELLNPRVEYRLETRAEDGSIVVDRHLRMKAGTTEQHNVIHMDKDIQRILAFESAPLLLEGERGTR